MVKSLALAAMVASAAAFAPAPFMGTRLAAVKAASSAVTMSVKEMPGVSAPLGFFDPLGFASKASPETITKYRESELRHGRTAMLAVLGWAFTEAGCHLPVFPNAGTNPLAAAGQVPFWGWAQIFAFCGVIEFVQAKIRERPGFQAGDYIGSGDLMDEGDDQWKSFQTKELNNGRLAMLASIGLIGQTAIFGQNILEQSTGKATLF
ncbi:fucoxanthin chlorophyll a c protein [Tribonema minus]|uniref:Fucoxanthin chlorophyll a c protein n=1 Tax=Tribonema minus TaxID=303371 RepID=A0A835YRG9_9STRA|nr:fucoxanthin chlorophyll a c protein [Tribonema minus]